MRRGPTSDADTAMGGGNHRFPSTRHSLLADAAAEGDTGSPARNAIVAAYWKPIYKYIRLRWGKSNDDAKDLTQDFFVELFERELLTRFDPSKASFRTYLRLAVDGLAANARQAEGRLKRGGGSIAVPLDQQAAEQELAITSPQGSPEEIFLREWQRQVFALAIEDLAQKAAALEKDTAFRLFVEYDLADEERPTYDQLASTHGVATTSVTNSLAWARRELKRAVLERIQSVTSTRQELRQEARTLFRGSRR